VSGLQYAAPLTAISIDGLAAEPELLAALIDLNNQHAAELSWADEDRFRCLVANAFRAQRVGRADALLIAFDQDAAYDSPNFQWFRARFDRFVYVDRVVTSAPARNRGLAKMLYEALITSARQEGHHRLVCEINSDPPNPASETFHRKLGFFPVGSAVLSNGKTVTYQEMRIAGLRGMTDLPSTAGRHSHRSQCQYFALTVTP
jgi:uncharacterized protein